MYTTRLSSRGQLVIPKALRDAHGWGENSEFVVREQGGAILLEPAATKTKTLADIVGCLPKPKRKVSLAELCAPVSNYQD